MKSSENQVGGNELYRALFEGSVEGYLILDPLIRDCNRKALELLGFKKEELIGRSFLELAPPEQPDGTASEDVFRLKTELAAEGSAAFFYWQCRRHDLSTLDTEVWLRSIHTGQKNEPLLIGIRDVTESLRLSAELARSQAELRKLLENSRRDEQLIRSLLAASADPVMIFNSTGRCRFVNDAFTNIFGWTAEELADNSKIFVPETALDSEQWLWKELRALRPVSGLETVRRTKNGREIPVSVSAAAVLKDGTRQPADALFILRDVTSQHEASQALRRAYEIQKELAERDPLTGLFNHRRIHDELDKEIVRARRLGSFFSIMVMDLDHFKSINDRHGHLFGDEALRLLSDVLQHNTRASDVVGRYGGDEFLVILPGADYRGAGLLARRVIQELKATPLVTPSGETVLVECSVGAATFPFDAADKTELINEADKAMYRSKSDESRFAVSFGPSNISALDWPDHPDKLFGLLDILDKRDQYSLAHAERTAKLAGRLGRELQLPEEEMKPLDMAAKIHSLGQIYIPEEIRTKTEKLTREEDEILRQHPVYLHKLLQNVEGLDENVLEAIKHHQENWDGTGLPDGLKGEAIPMAARIIRLAATVADWEMEQEMGMGEKSSLEFLLNSKSGKELDSSLVKAFLVMSVARGAH